MPMTRTAIPAPFDDDDNRFYADAVAYEINRMNPDLAATMTTRCTECDDLGIKNPSDHCLIGNIVIIGCEGYWLINPNVIGIPSPNWGDWTKD